MYSLNNDKTGASLSAESFDDCIHILDTIFGDNNYSLKVDDEMSNVWWVTTAIGGFMITSMARATFVKL